MDNSFKIYIKPELFDHLIYPINVKLDDEKIISLFRKLHIMSEIDFKIPMKEWLKNASEIGLTKTEATVLFQTFKIYEGDLPESSSSTKNRYESSTNNKNSVDVRYFGLFFALQSFSQRTKISLIVDKTEKNPSYFTSPLSSPRGKSSNNYRLASQGLEYQFILNYIKSNLKLFLRIVASDIHNTETTICANEFNTLKFLFTIEDNKHNSIHDKNKKGVSLSNYLHCFDNLPPVTKINMNIINEFLLSTLSNSAPELSNYCTIKGLSKCVTIKTGNEYQNKNLLISNCDDTYIYINTNVSNCKISLCTNCTIVIAVASKIITLDKCEKCNICIISNFTRISNMIDSNVYLFSVNEPILYGDNRGLRLGPHNVTYNELYIHVKESRLTISQNSYKNFSLPIYLNNNNNNKEHINIIKPEEFTTIVVPFEANDPFNYILTPKPYLEVIQKRYNNYANIQKMIKEAGFQESQEKAFHIALQGFFREWLVTSGNFKPMNDLVKMIDEPYGIGPLNSK
jgi:TBCC domain-containing protein 1